MRKIREATEETIADGRFDPLTLMEIYSHDPENLEGKETVSVRERGFVPSELVLMLRTAGFGVERIWGGTAGNWKREQLDLDEMEMMIIARKERV
jgi:hypothetical protein